MVYLKLVSEAENDFLPIHFCHYLLMDSLSIADWGTWRNNVVCGHFYVCTGWVSEVKIKLIISLEKYKKNTNALGNTEMHSLKLLLGMQIGL